MVDRPPIRRVTRRGLAGAIGCLMGVVMAAAAPGVAVAATKPSGTPTATAASSTVAAPTTSPLSGGVNPISPVQTATSTAPTATATSTSATAGSSTLSPASGIAIVVGAIIILGGIAFYIWRDARRRAPHRASSADALVGGRKQGSKAPPKPRKLSPAERRRRKRGKARR